MSSEKSIESIGKVLRDYVVHEFLNDQPMDFDDDTPLRESGILDSFSAMMLTNFLEERFGVLLPRGHVGSHEMPNLRAIGKVVRAGRTR